MNKPVAWIGETLMGRQYINGSNGLLPIGTPLYTHPVKEQDDYCKAYWGNNNKFVDVFLPNSETEVIRFWNNTHPVKELTDEEIKEAMEFAGIRPSKEWGLATTGNVQLQIFAKAILRKAQEK